MSVGLRPRECAYVIVPSRVEEVVKVRKVIGTLTRMDGFSEDDVISIEVAVGEGLANAVRHGSPNGEMDEVEVTYEHVSDCYVVVTISDRGTGFDLREWLKEIKPLTLSEGERGLFLIAELMDEVEYTLTEQGGCLSIKKYASDLDRDTFDTERTPMLRISSRRRRVGDFHERDRLVEPELCAA